MSQINQAQHGIASGPGGGTAPSGGYPVFDTVVYYEAPSDTAITPAVGELSLIGLGAIGDNVVFTLPNAGSEGQVIGCEVLLANPGDAVSFNGRTLPVDDISEQWQSVVWSWDAEFLFAEQTGWWIPWVQCRVLVAPSLQAAYDGGNTIDLAADTPVELNAPTDSVALQITHDGGAPPADLGIVDVSMSDDTGSWAALLIENAGTATAQTRIVRLLNAGRAEVWFELRPDALYFNVPRATQTYALLVASEGKALSLQTDRALAGDGSTCGQLKVGPAFGPDNCDGGITIEGVDATDVGTCTGRVRIETHALGATVGDDRRGALRLPNVGTAASALECDPPAEGDCVLRVDDIGEVTPRTKGFRGYRAAAWGLFNRGFQQPFDDASLTAGVLTIVHDLDTSAPIVQLYEDIGGVPTQVPAGASTFTVASPDGDTTTVTFDAGILPLTNPWTITIAGF